MTLSKTVSVKVPARRLRRLPAAGKGRSRFIITALEEKLSRQNFPEWKPTTERVRRLAALLEKGRVERSPRLDLEGLAGELAERRGRWH